MDVAAYRAEGKEVILLAYRYTPAEFVEGTALSIQSILDGYSAETSGTLFIVQDDQVIASNRPELIGQDAADSPLVQGDPQSRDRRNADPYPRLERLRLLFWNVLPWKIVSISMRIQTKDRSSGNPFR